VFAPGSVRPMNLVLKYLFLVIQVLTEPVLVDFVTAISRLGSLGALNQAQTQAGLDAQREATRMAAYQPQEQLQNYGNLVTGIMGGMAGSGTQTSQVPNPGFLQTALGAAATGAGIYGALRPRNS